MAFNKIPTQAKFFYGSKWTAEMDTCFLTELVSQREQGNWADPTKSFHAILTARGVVNQTFEKNLTWDDVYERQALLETRYHTFTQVIEDPNADWVPSLNFVIAGEEAWRDIFKKNIFAQAYYHSAEPEFTKLVTLFGSGNNTKVVEHEIITISDSSNHFGEPPANYIMVSDEDEVMSPLPPDLPRIRRRLFDEDPDSTTLESSNNKESHNFEVEPNAPSKFPLRNAFPVKPKEKGGTSKATGSSSCASSSPSKWWFRPFK